MNIGERWKKSASVVVGLWAALMLGSCIDAVPEANDGVPDICEPEPIICEEVEAGCGLFGDGCGGDVDCGLCAGEERLEIRPEEVLLAVGERAQLEVVWRSEDGEEAVDTEIDWTSLTPGVSVDSAGMVEALDFGQWRVAAEVDGERAERRIDVAGPASRGVISLSEGRVHVEEAIEMKVDFYDEDGVPTRAVELQWSIEDEAIAVVDDGVIQGVASGTTIVRAQGEGVSAELEVDVYFEWAQVYAGDSHSCGLSKVGVAYCWGRNDRGQLGDNQELAGWEPRKVDGDLRFEKLSLGDQHSCGRSVEGPVYCWGDNNRGQVGVAIDAAEPNVMSPQEVELRRTGGENERLDFAALNTGREYNCGATAVDGEVYCWGYNIHGQVGLNPATTESEQDRPRRVALDGAQALEVGTAYFFSCAVMDDDTLRCWGRQGPALESLQVEGGGLFVAPQELEIDRRLTRLEGGADFLCGVDDSNGLWCWGANAKGQLGQGDTDNRSEPEKVAALTVGEVSASDLHICAIDAGDNGVYCWGNNATGQINSGEDTSVPEPVKVELPESDFVDVAAGISHSCAVALGGRAFCWGSEEFGRLGAEAGTEEWVEVPQF